MALDLLWDLLSLNKRTQKHFILGAILLSFVIFVTNGENLYNFPTVCERFPDIHCPNGECTRYEQIKCENGKCNNSTGLCECEPCWAGKSCDILENNYLPSFDESSLSVVVNNYNVDDVITYVAATDKDGEKCKASDADCPCARIIYALESGNEDSLFHIHPKTGAIQLSGKGIRNKSEFPPPGTHLILVISARNPVHRSRRRRRRENDNISDGDDDKVVDTMIVMVEFDDEPVAEVNKYRKIENHVIDEVGFRYRRSLSDDSQVVHSRRRRSNSGAPSEATFFLEKIGDAIDMTEVNIGENVELRLTLWLPTGTTTDVDVEFLSENENGAVFILFDPSITTVGGNFPSFDTNNIVTSYSASAGDGRHDRVLMNLGDITNNGDDTADDEPNQIELQFKAILTVNEATQYDVAYDLSAAVTYGSSDDIWAGTTSFTPVDDRDDWAIASPLVSISGPDGQNMSVESSAIFSIDIVLRNYASENVVVDLIADNFTADPVMTICDYEVTGKGSNYDCMSDESYTFSTKEVNGTIWTVLSTLDLGTWVNQGLRYGSSTDASNTISTEAIVHLTDSTEIEDYSTYWFGVAVSVNNEMIYSNQYGIHAQPISSPDMTTEPTIDFYPIDGNQLVVGACVGFVVTIDLQEEVTSRLIVDLSLPVTSNSETQMRVCSAQVVSAGYNIPCASKVVPTYVELDGENRDYVRLDFGRVTNIGRRSEAGDNELKVHISAQLLFDAPDASNGTELTITAGVRYEMEQNDLVWMVQYPLLAVDQRLADYTSAAKHPSFTLTNRADDDYLYPKSAVSFEIEIEIPAETTHPDLIVIIKAPKDDRDMKKPFMSICRVEVLTVSDLFPCYNANRTIFTHESSSNNSAAIDKTTVNLGVISNTYLEEMMTANPDSKATVTLGVFMHWEDHEYHEDDATLPVTVMAEWGHEGSWSDTIDYVTELNTDPALESSDESPQFQMTLDAGRSRHLKAGSTAVYTLVMYTPVNTVTTYALDVTAPNDTLSVCRAHFRYGGDNIPCFDERDEMLMSYEEDGHRDRAFLDLGPVRNTGITTSNQADNRIVGQVVVKMEEAALPPDNLTLPDPQGFGVTVQVGETDSWSFADTLTVDTNETIPNNLNPLPDATLTKLHAAESRVTIGGVVEFNLDIFIPPESIAHYEIEFQSDIDEPYKTTICEARIIATGWNIPCVNGSFIETIYNSSTDNQHIDIAYLDVGVITNMRMKSEGLPVKYDKNMVRVQLLTRLELNDTIVEGDEFWLGGAVKIDEFNEIILQSGFNATEEPLYPETYTEPTFHVKRPQGNLSLTIGEKARYYLNISTTVTTTPMAINLSLPIAGDEAFLTITDIQLEHVGKNFGCFQLWDEEFIPTTVSSLGSSQNDTALIDFGVISNHGTSHKYQYLPSNLGDDDIIVSFEIQLADHYQLVNQTLLDFTITFLYSLDREVTFTETVEALMMPWDLPIIDINMTIEDYYIRDVHQGDVVQGRISLKHNERSSSHAHAVMINLMTPHFIGVDPLIEIEGPSLCTETSDEGIKFHFSEMFFTDIFTMWFNITIDEDRYMPIEMDVINTTVPLEVVYYKTGGLDDNDYVILGDVFSTELELLDLTYTIEACAERLDYAMSRECQFTASSTLNDSHAPHTATINSMTGWAPGSRYMLPYLGNDYLQVKYPSLMRFSGIKMQQGPNGTHYVDSFQISYSEEDVVWFDYEQDGAVMTFQNYDYHAFVPEVNVTEDPWVIHLFANPFNARFFRIRPQTHKNDTNYPILRFELYGCLREIESGGADVCAVEHEKDFGYFERGFLVDPITWTVYVCLLEYIDGPTRCSYSKDNGTIWEAIDNSVANVIGIHNETSELYGISQNKESMVISTDLGDKFYSTNPDYYYGLLAEPGRIIQTMKIPWDDIEDEPDNDDWEYSMMTLPEPLSNTTTASISMEWAGAKAGLYFREIFFDGMNSTTVSNWTLIGDWGYP
ncbi:uncharacterized protein LOC129256638 [Lytechinus pictus]|uniref:uncharacterized protein LOC129256638 n=1 Tax=Lytechinus pictus TaxID=7653 RepID=UPI0030B9D9B3